MTSESYLQSHPETVRRFVRATCRGWERYLADPQPTNAEIHRLNPEMDQASLQEAAEILRTLCVAQDGTIGRMSADRWRGLAQQMTELGIVRLPMSEVDRCYSLDVGP
jgi:NitT/TauT family transport system substrate-binding protein